MWLIDRQPVKENQHYIAGSPFCFSNRVDQKSFANPNFNMLITKCKLYWEGAIDLKSNP